MTRPKTFTVLIANRGEIALRVIRACRLLGIRTVAVYSRCDQDSLHTRMADSAWCIGADDIKHSYGNAYAILSAAEASGADAIHPGYGFFSENASFARQAQEAGFCWLGPDHSIIALMGDKITAKKTMAKHGIPMVPGSDGPLPNCIKTCQAIAERVGYPVLIKATAGGGGRGITRVNSADDLAQAIATTQACALSLYQNDQVYLEKCLTHPRHIELQIIADQHGQVFCVGERDCSLQRRQQKIIEEGPCIELDPQALSRIRKQCVTACQAIGYVGAGTIEFLYQDGQFYFIEMNTRIQVEHPVTECVSGIDLVCTQIQCHRGVPLTLNSDIALKQQGFAIECRINAEDPHTYAPSPGVVTHYHAPGGPGVRVDSHVYQGYHVPHCYDSLIAKIIVHQPTREKAIKSMQQALREMVVAGIKTNIPLHQALLASNDFQRGALDIHYLNQNTLLISKCRPELEVV
ncbi:MAG: acetyl-CoA carboxylase biotin carboxylase subunit [Pseudomonadota bacterium]|nr:acetyl-CoA carboxylase biotin carboxylase subunit [Pseudomonadota bacterium]